MDSSSQLTIAYDTLYYVKFTALSIKTISRPLPIIVLQISAVKGTDPKFWSKIAFFFFFFGKASSGM